MSTADAPTQQPAVPAPTVGPAPADHPDTTPAGYVGRHRASYGKRGQRHLIDRPVPGDWSPLHPADRQALAPGWWADRQLPAGPDERTGRLHLDDIQTARTEGPATA